MQMIPAPLDRLARGLNMDARLTLYELEIMDVVWRLGEATVQDVCDHLSRELAYTTVMTTLSLLERKKKVLNRDKRGRAFVYRPAVTRDEVSRAVLGDLQQVLFRKSWPSLMLNMLNKDQVTEDEIQALKKAIRDLEAGA